ncbi:hypothetical protein L0F63_000060, partial [Massospora cicadina]
SQCHRAELEHLSYHTRDYLQDAAIDDRLTESINDTPRFRAQLAEYDSELAQFEVHLKAIIRAVKDCNDASQSKPL